MPLLVKTFPKAHPTWQHCRSTLLTRCNSRASAKLFEDAAREEAEEQLEVAKRRPPPQTVSTHENWTGDESIQDAVLRMLVDKYKPLRSGHIRSADEKIKSSLTNLSPTSSMISEDSDAFFAHSVPSSSSSTGASADHKPWLVTFKVPSHAAKIKFARLPPSPKPSPVSAPPPTISCIKQQKRAKQVARVTEARESSLDYRIGRRSGQQHANPSSMKGWASLVEERIEKARIQGQFKVLSGRGKPLVREVEERNPFVAREEFLMNRIVQRNGAAPPWVEIQGEMESSLQSLRLMLRSSWIRRTVRMLTLTGDAAHNWTIEELKHHRDPEWEQRELAFHEQAITDLNSLIRKYNTVAPYVVRRPYTTRETELQLAIEGSAQHIYEKLQAKDSAQSQATGSSVEDISDDPSTSSTGATGSALTNIRLRDVLRDLWQNMRMSR
ncbi:hypothetical protein SISSUDRAFT_976541 [Sistotremastrum suecicum HHB10207 ss-3]|uniref:DnaJ homologue subfamily C member 28 conserved domain-containing protein n=1 Tax=Sistotremastrum suecicum HHB10207 ss-3 TaxID=1314776 RepID=A0A166J1E3_9AGAM|nr:hypothetical protein SISSUDRAFT_976541 [Sistotremastrum suecicum HHB10207 ss-3]